MEKSFEPLLSAWAAKAAELQFTTKRSDNTLGDAEHYMKPADISASIESMARLVADTVSLAEGTPTSKDAKTWRVMVDEATSRDFSADQRLKARGDILDIIDKINECELLVRFTWQPCWTPLRDLFAGSADWIAALNDAKQALIDVHDLAEEAMEIPVDDLVELARKRSETKKDAKGKTPLRPLPKAQTTLARTKPVADSDLPTDKAEDDRDITAGDAVFPAGRAMYGYVRTAGKTRPMRNGKPVNGSDVLAPGVEWVEVAEPVVYAVKDSTLEMLRIFMETGLMPSEVFNEAVRDGVYADDDHPLQKGLPLFDLAKKDQRAANHVNILFYWAQCEHLLKLKGAQRKLPFVNKWMRRLMDVPDTLSNAAPLVAERFFAFLKRATKADTPCTINQVFHSFLNGNLASWRKGESRDKFFDRCRKSVAFYWGDYAEAYYKAVLELPDFQFQVRPELDSITKKLKKLAEQKRKDLYKAAEGARNATGQAAEKARSRIQQQFDEYQNTTANLTFRQKVAVYYGKFRKRLPKYESWSFEEAIDDAYAYMMGTCLSLAASLMNASGEQVTIEVKGQKRQVTRLSAIWGPFIWWWDRWTDDTRDDVITPGWIPRIVQAPLGVLYFGGRSTVRLAKLALIKAGRLFNNYTDSEDADKLAANIGTPPLKRLAKAVAVTGLAALAAFGISIAAPASGVAGALGFIAGFDVTSRAIGYWRSLKTSFASKVGLVPNWMRWKQTERDTKGETSKAGAAAAITPSQPPASEEVEDLQASKAPES